MDASKDNNMMNYIKKQKENRNLKKLFKANYPEGCVKIVGTVSSKHEITKAAVAHWLKANGYEIWTEARLSDGSRPDIIAINGQFGYILEIMCSETEKRFLDKLQQAYNDFMVIPIRADNFDYDTFKL